MDLTKEKMPIAALLVAMLSLIISIATMISRSSSSAVEAALASELAEHERLLAAIEKRGAGASGSAALGTYLNLARKDGVASQAALRAELNALERNTSRILAYLDLYEPEVSGSARLNAIRAARVYAIAWLDREDSLLELYMLGGGYGVSAPTYPTELRELIDRK